MAEYVTISFQKYLKNQYNYAKNLLHIKDDIDLSILQYKEEKDREEYLNDADITPYLKDAYIQACKDTEEETRQAMEAVVYNLNSLHSRAGSQVGKSAWKHGNMF